MSTEERQEMAMERERQEAEAMTRRQEVVAMHRERLAASVTIRVVNLTGEVLPTILQGYHRNLK